MQTSTLELKLPSAPLKVRRTGQGQPLVLLHGGGGPIAEGPLVQQLARNFEVIEPVHPGFSGSTLPPGFDTVADIAYLYLDMLEALDLRDVTLAGLTLGGWIAAEMAAMNTARMSRLILINAIGIKPGGRDVRDLPDIFAMSPQDVERTLYFDPKQAPSQQSFTEEQWQMAAANRHVHGIYVWEPYMHNPKLKRRLHRVNIPTLLLWGRENRMATPQYGEAYSKLIPGSRIEFIEAAGHSIHLEQPEALARSIAAFTKA